MSEDRILMLVDRLRAARDHFQDYSQYLQELKAIAPNADVLNLCESSYYSDETVAGIISGYESTVRSLSRDELVALVAEFLGRPEADEARRILIVVAVNHNSIHPDGADIMIGPEVYFDGDTMPDPERIVDLILQKKSPP